MTTVRKFIEHDSSADRLIETIARDGPMTVRDLVKVLGVTTTAVRQQVDRLTSDGWLMRSRRTGRTGRPADVFAVSEKGNRLFAGLLDDFTGALVAEVAAEIEPTRSRALFQAAGKRITHELRDTVGEGSTSERLRRLTEFLSQRGVLADTEQTRQGTCMTLHRCPYGQLADGHDEICHMEQEIFGEVIGELPALEQERHDGHRHCAFTFARTRASAAGQTPAKNRRKG